MPQVAAVLFAGLGVGAAGALLWLPLAPRWLALGAVGSAVGAFACAEAARRLRRLRRHRFRILRDRYTLVLRPDETAIAAGALLARGHVRIETVYQSLHDGQASVRLQKFVSEPTGMDPGALLEEWNYACRVVGPGAGPAAGEGEGGAGDRDAVLEARLSRSRSLQVEVALPRPVASGETFTLVEDLDFASELGDDGASFMFQVAYPTRSHDVEVLFEGLRPEGAEYRINRGEAVAETGGLRVDELGGARYRIVHAWRRPEVGEELALRWLWDARALPAGASGTEALIAEARARQAALQERLAAQIEVTEDEGAVSAGPSEPAGARASAEDHPLIKAARERERLLYGRTDAPAPKPAASEGPRPRTEDLMAEALARQTSIRDLLAAQVEAEAASADGKAGDEAGEGASAEDHPIIKAARERERLLYGRTDTALPPRRSAPGKEATPGAETPGPARKPPREPEP